MKLLFDQNLSFHLCSRLNDLFPESAHVRQLGLHQADDRVIRQYAAEGEYTIVSLDSDFSELSALYGSPPKVIWLRCGNQPTSVIEALIRHHADTIRQFERDTTSNCLEVHVSEANT